MNSIIGIDLGGTTIKGGRLDSNKLTHIVSLPTCAHIGGDVTMKVLMQVIDSLITSDVKAIGIGVPSVVDREKGIAYDFVNIRDWSEVDFKGVIERRYGIPVFVDNDANCFALSERFFGKGKNYENFVGITLGTGLGGGIINKGSLISDANCGSGEFGEIPYLSSNFEDYCGCKFFTMNYGCSGAELARNALNGDKMSCEAFIEYGKHLGQLVKVVMYAIDPQAIIFGGAISSSFSLFEKGLKASMSDFVYHRSLRKVVVEASVIQHSGILGAAAICLNTNLNI